MVLDNTNTAQLFANAHVGNDLVFVELDIQLLLWCGESIPRGKKSFAVAATLLHKHATLLWASWIVTFSLNVHHFVVGNLFGLHPR